MDFRNDFMWGVASSSYQIEGAVNEDGKGQSIWDVFCRQEGKIKNGETGEIACDHYHRYAEDIALMAQLGVNTYRFSISWPRILPDGIGRVNPKGIAFYSKLVDCLLEKGITPIATLYHWDYPLALQEKGGWKNPDSPKWFEYYADVITKALGDRVKFYFTFNEPQCFIGAGTGDHAPGIQASEQEMVGMAHNVMLAHGLAVRKIRENVVDSKVSFTSSALPYIPNTEAQADVEAAREKFFDLTPWWVWSAVWWSDPIILGHYPENMPYFQKLKQYLPDSWREDLKTICQPLDFYSQNIYTGNMLGKDGSQIRPVGVPMTAMDWPVVPRAVYWGVKFLYERYKLPIFLSENGMADLDWVCLDGKVHDPNRIDYLRRYISEFMRAGEDGVELIGYSYWSFTDNFEWAEGYTKRFGLVYVDYETQERIPKDSFYWYQKVIQTNGEIL